MDYFEEMEEALSLNDENKPLENHPVFYLPCGDIHVCKGLNCPHVALTYEKSYVCSLSGHCCGALSVREDFSTGRQVGSSNPDDRGGLPVGGQWSKKVNMHLMSMTAYMGANNLEDEVGIDLEASGGSGGSGGSGEASAEVSGTLGTTGTPTPRSDDQRKQPTSQTETPLGNKTAPKVKRGARCVDQVDDDLPRRKRRSVSSVDLERQAHLKQDVASTLCKLVSYDKKSTKVGRLASKQRDPRLQDREFVTTLALKKYVKECLSSGSNPNLDDIHNICITAASVAVEEKRRSASAVNVGNGAKQAPLVLKVRMRETISALVVSLWLASLKTPYMKTQRRGADSFRPFCVGVTYALKRGVSLPDGTVVVPACPILTDALPTLRSAAPNSSAKALHASSHRGLCTLHRCISSCSNAEAHDLYSSSTGIAASLARDVASGRFDL